MTNVDSDIVLDTLTDETDDSCVLQLIEIVPLDRTSHDDYKPEFIDPVVEVKPEDLQDVKQEPTDDYNTDEYHKPGFIPRVVEVKPEDLQDVKQEPADITDDYKPGFIPRVVEVKPEDLQDVKQEPADDYKPEFIDPVVEYKPVELQDVKQEPADDYNTEDPCFTIQVRSPSTCSTTCCRLMICFFQCGTFLPLDILPRTFPRPTQILSTLWILIPSIKVKI